MIYIITPEQKEMIEDALAVSTTPLNKDRQTVLKAFAIMKSLKVQEPVAYAAAINGEIAWDADYPFSNEPFVCFDDESAIPLYALGDEK